MARSLPLRRSLLARLLAVSVLVAIAAGAATTWLAVTGTSQDLLRQQSQGVADGADIYHQLVGYAATHRSWAEVGGLVHDLAEHTHRRVILTTTDRHPIASSAPSPDPLPAIASALVDPLRVDPALSTYAAADPIDPRAVGPYALGVDAKSNLAAAADDVVMCMTKRGFGVTTSQLPSGRTVVVETTGTLKAHETLTRFCAPQSGLDTPTPAEKTALDELNRLVAACLRAKAQPPVDVQVDFSWTRTVDGDDNAAQECVSSGRRQQLAGYVAPPATLFIVDPAAVPAQSAGLSPGALARIIAVAASVLLLAVVVTILVGRRLVRPLRLLTEAARQPADRRIRVPVTTRDEIGSLAVAFNDLSERRERAEDQRREMVGDIAHELRTPLTNIRGWLEAVEDGVASSASDPELMPALLREALLLQRIVDDLQDLTAADSGALRLCPDQVAVADLLGQVATAHRSLADGAGVQLVVEVSESPVVLADPARLRQVVGNLVTNAVRHTHAGGHVHLRARYEDDIVVVEVADTGTGIDAADLPQVFDRFWRGEKSRNRLTGGSGLGLAIVRQLTEAHGGTVGVVSEVNAGSVFTVRLPARRKIHGSDKYLTTAP